MNWTALRDKIVGVVEPYLEGARARAWVERNGAALRELALKHGGAIVVRAVQACAASGVRRLEFFAADSARWLDAAKEPKPAAPEPPREPVACPACEAPMTLSWCRVCGYEVGDSPERIEEARAAVLAERRDPVAAQAKRDAVLQDFHARLPWARGRSANPGEPCADSPHPPAAQARVSPPEDDDFGDFPGDGEEA